VDRQDESSVFRGNGRNGLRLFYEKETSVRALPDPPGDRDRRRRALQIRNTRDGDPVGTVAIALDGELDLTSADELDTAIREAEDTDIGWIVVDLSDVSFIDSTGLSVLLQAKKRSNGRLSCIRSNHNEVTWLLELTGTVQGLDPD
jgi:anti-sigma B factor antagonist